MNSEIVIYQNQDGNIKIDVRLEEETVWLSQEQMAKMDPYNPNIHHRRSIRLKGYDYSQTGLYFIVICCNRIGELHSPYGHTANHWRNHSWI